MGRPVTAHLKVDTGMARLGVRPAELPAFCEAMKAFPEVSITGLMTHLASADAEEVSSASDMTAHQVARFEEATTLLVRAGVVSRDVVRHAANSAALLRGTAVFDAVRPGLAIFGASPLGSHTRGSELRSVMRVRSEIVDVRTIEVGETVGYGGLFRASRRTRVATVPIGYADGFSRHVSGRAQVLVRGARANVIGAVSMDMHMIDVTDLAGASLCDEVVVLGGQEGALGKGVITVDEVAHWAGTIPWEVLTSISRRVPRFYREP
jgi:alanine racemase